MRFVLAIVLFVTAFVAIGVGIAQRTVWAGPESLTLEATTDSGAVLTLLPGEVLNAHEGRQSIVITGEGAMTAASGRTEDVLSWIGDARHNLIEIDHETGEFAPLVIEGSEQEVPPLAGSDLWLTEHTQENMLSFAIDVPEDYSVIIAADGVLPAPESVSVTWPLDNSTPWAEPLVLGGLGLLVAGLIALAWALIHLRRSRGPRRRQPKLPKPPTGRRYRSAPRAISSGRRSFRALPVAVLAAIAVGAAGAAPASAQQAPGIHSTAEETSEETGAPEVELRPTAVTESQLRRIVSKIGQTVEEADEARDADLAATRLAGPALEFREASYAIRGADEGLGALPAIPARRVQLTLPQQLTLPSEGETWPRTVFTVVRDSDEENAAPIALVLVQEDARSQYKAHYAITLEPDTVLPDVAPAEVGAARLPVDTKLLSTAPKDLPAMYGDVLAKGAESEFSALFDTEEDGLQPQIAASHEEIRSSLPETAQAEFSFEPGEGDVIAMATNDAGALVAFSIDETQTVKPVQEGAAVNTQGAVKALSGKDQSTKGISATYGNQLLVYVPPVTGDGQVVLLGYSFALTAASEIP